MFEADRAPALCRNYVECKFLVKLGKTATETHDLLRIVYADDSLSRTQVFEWFKKFKEGREVIEDNPRPGRQRTSKSDGNVKKIREIIRKNRCLSIRAIAGLVNIDKETVRQRPYQDKHGLSALARI